MFNMTFPVSLLLTNASLQCGESGALSDECVIVNGPFQVQSMENVDIHGVTFRSSSLLHSGNGSLVVQDCTFEGQGSVVNSVATAGTTLVDCSFENIDFSLSTDNANETTKALVSVSQSTLTLERVYIDRIDAKENSPFDLIRAEGSFITLTDCEIANNVVDHLVVAFGESNITLEGTTFQGNNLTNGLVLEGSTGVKIDKCQITGNSFSEVSRYLILWHAEIIISTQCWITYFRGCSQFPL